MKNVLKPLAKSVIILLGLTAAASATAAAIQRKTFGSCMTTLIISNKEMNEIMKIIKSLKNAGLFIKGVSETTENEAKEPNRGFLTMLLGMLRDSLLGNLLTVKGVKQPKIPGQGVMRADEGTIRAGHLLTNFEIQNYYQNKAKFNGAYLRNNLPKISDGTYVINLDEYKYRISLDSFICKW